MSDSIDYLTRCAENEGGRAILCLQGYGNIATAVYFAREAAHYARLVLAQRETMHTTAPTN